MKKITTVLSGLRTRPPLGSGTTEIYVVINPPDEEPKVERQTLTDEQLAHSGNRSVMRNVLEHVTLSTIKKWRGA